MFKVGDRLQFIDEKDTKVIVCYNDMNDPKDENFLRYKYIMVRGVLLKNQETLSHVTHIKLLEYDCDYYRKLKLKKLIGCLK